MTTTPSSQRELLEARLAHVAPLLRGVLAMPSGRDDDRYSRVILRSAEDVEPETGLSGLAINGFDWEASPDDIRERLRAAVDAHREECGRLPQSVALDDQVNLLVESVVSDARHPLENKIALVTGAAGAIGAGICRGLMEKGCRVAASDVARERLEGLVTELSSVAEDRVMGVVQDVTDAESVADGSARVARKWGGVDIVVVNAGIAHVSELVDMDPEDFRRVQKVNVDGTLLTLAEAGRHMRAQGTGGDIVVVSTKNVFCPGASFGAYSATKAASHQLARIASLEFAPFDVRVNMVSPDAVFGDSAHKSGLWQAVGPSRMKARGLDEKGLEEYYQGRNLLKARVTPEHVSNAVLFFVTRQTPTTGATIPVDGGLPDSTPR